MIILLAPCGSSVKRFQLNGHTIGFCLQTSKVRTTEFTKQIVPCESTAEEVSFNIGFTYKANNIM